MNGLRQIGKGVSVARFISVCTLAICLVFLTSLNFFIYPSTDTHHHTQMTADNQGSTEDDNDVSGPAGPTEEKSCNSGFSILEEFLHENHPLLNFEGLNQQYMHQVAEADKIEVFHGELISPPPEC